MELKDFTEQEQKQIEKGLSTAEISDKEAAKKLLALVRQEWIKDQGAIYLIYHTVTEEK